MKKIIFLTLIFLNKCFASTQNIDKTQEISEVLGKNAYEPNYFSMILGLFFVVGLIYITGFLYQKLTKAANIDKKVYLNKAQIISTTSLGQGRNIHVIKVGNEAFLVGATQSNITFLKDIELTKIDEEPKQNLGDSNDTSAK